MDCWPVQSELKGSPACTETSLLHPWRPSSQTPLGVIPMASPSLPDRAASDQGPGQRTVTYGVVAARRGPQWNKPHNNARTAASAAPGTTLTGQPGTLRMVMWRC